MAPRRPEIAASPALGANLADSARPRRESRIRALKRRAYIGLLAIVFVAGGVGVWALTHEKGAPDVAPTAPAGPAATATAPEGPSATGRPEGTQPTATETAEREAIAAVRRYVRAIDRRDGEVLCDLVAAIAELDLPVKRGDCARSVSASIGYRDPRGYPVFASAKLTGQPDVDLDGNLARATATIVTRFADRDEPSVEDDVIFLERRGGGWAVAKPSSTLYRAIGSPDVPPGVLAPPD